MHFPRAAMLVGLYAVLMLTGGATLLFYLLILVAAPLAIVGYPITLFPYPFDVLISVVALGLLAFWFFEWIAVGNRNRLIEALLLTLVAIVATLAAWCGLADGMFHSNSCPAWMWRADWSVRSAVPLPP